MSAPLPLAVYCVDGPLAGQGFTDKDWRTRLEAARNLGADGRGHALHYRTSKDAPDLSGFPKARESLAGFAVTWMRWSPPPDRDVWAERGWPVESVGVSKAEHP